MEQQLTDTKGKPASKNLAADLTPNRLQAVCDHSPICAAYTTGGDFYTVSETTGKIGPVERMTVCQNSQIPGSNTHCRGSYVFDGQMSRKQQRDSASPQTPAQGPVSPRFPSLYPWPPSETATAGGGGLAAATSVTETLKPQYVRAASAGGGVGKVGKEQCSLC